MKEDKELIAGVIGVISIIPSEIVSQILIHLGYAKHSTCTLSSLLITGNIPSMTMGIIINFIMGGFIAVLLYEGFRKLGSQHLVIKCVGVSLLMWLALELVFTIFIERKLIPVRGMSGYYSHFLGAIIYGITEGVLFSRYLFYKHIKDEQIELHHVDKQPVDEPIKVQIVKEQNIEAQHKDDKQVYDMDKLIK